MLTKTSCQWTYGRTGRNSKANDYKYVTEAMPWQGEGSTSWEGCDARMRVQSASRGRRRARTPTPTPATSGGRGRGTRPPPPVPSLPFFSPRGSDGSNLEATSAPCLTRAPGACSLGATRATRTPSMGLDSGQSVPMRFA